MNEALRPFDLSERSALVIGAGSDMGRATCRHLAAAGARVVAADLDEPGAQRAALGAREAAGRDQAGESAVVDVTRRADVGELVERVWRERAGLAALVNLAGVIHDEPVAEVDEATLDRTLAVNLKGVFFACQAAGPRMAERGRGAIVNMASAAAFSPYPQLACYSMSKAGVVALTRVLAAELGPAGVRVNALAPGYVEGEMSRRRARRADGSLDLAAVEADRERARRRAPLRTTGTPEDIASAVLFLVSDASRYLTGQVLHPNGGSWMP